MFSGLTGWIGRTGLSLKQDYPTQNISGVFTRNNFASNIHTTVQCLAVISEKQNVSTGTKWNNLNFRVLPSISSTALVTLFLCSCCLADKSKQWYPFILLNNLGYSYNNLNTFWSNSWGHRVTLCADDFSMRVNIPS